jgi:hypothetical protein
MSTQLPIQCVPGLKRLQHEVNNLRPTSGDVKNETTFLVLTFTVSDSDYIAPNDWMTGNNEL